VLLSSRHRRPMISAMKMSLVFVALNMKFARIHSHEVGQPALLFGGLTESEAPASKPLSSMPSSARHSSITRRTSSRVLKHFEPPQLDAQQPGSLEAYGAPLSDANLIDAFNRGGADGRNTLSPISELCL